MLLLNAPRICPGGNATSAWLGLWQLSQNAVMEILGAEFLLPVAISDMGLTLSFNRPRRRRLHRLSLLLLFLAEQLTVEIKVTTLELS